jgi:AcrR family transcriptional regulator
MSASGLRRRLRRGERSEQLLDVAEGLFAARGYERTSIEAIARAAGVTRPIVYEHFGSKDGIYLACVQRARGQFHRAVLSAVVGVDGLSARLHAALDACFAFIETDPDRWGVMFRGAALTGTAGDESTRLRFETVAMLGAVIQDAVPGAPADEVQAYAHALSGAGEEMERWWRSRPDVPRATIVGHLHRFALFGVSRLADTADTEG